MRVLAIGATGQYAGLVVPALADKGVQVRALVHDPVFLNLFQGLLCLFLLEMGMTASRKLKDLKRGGVPFIILGIMMPILFSTIGITVLKRRSSPASMISLPSGGCSKLYCTLWNSSWVTAAPT